MTPNDTGNKPTGLNTTPTTTPVVIPQTINSNERLEHEMAMLRTELRSYEQANRNSKDVKEKLVVVQSPVLPVPVIINDARKEATSPVVATIIHDTVIRYVRDTVLLKADTVYVKADTVNITRTVDKIVTQETIKDNTKESLLELKLEKILFDMGKSNVKPVYNKGLNFVAKQLSVYKDLKIKLSGHTDKTGNPATNQRLSEARANAVKTYLITKGVSQSQIAIEYFGANDPADENKTAGGKLMNRRVELAFFQ